MDPPPAVVARYRKFINVFLRNPKNQSAAYRAAYPNCRDTTSHTEAGRLLRHPWVQAEIARRTKDVERKANVTIGDIVGNLVQAKNFDVRRLYAPVFDAEGAPQRNPETGEALMRRLEPWELDDDTAAAIDGLKVKDTRYGQTIDYKSAGKIPALELLARYKGMLKDPEKPPIVANISISF